jgi:3-oxoacyl-[acyl-carrier protein] reductase
MRGRLGRMRVRYFLLVLPLLTWLIQGEDLRDKIPLGRYCRPQEIADVVAFLCSDHASIMTGAVVDVNGGFVIA